MAHRKHPPIPERTVLGWRDLLERGWSDEEIAKYYGLHRTTISRMRRKSDE